MFHDVTLTHNSVTLRPERIDDSFRLHSFIDPIMWAGMAALFPTTVEEFQQLQRFTFDVDYFSVIREEWPQVQQRLEQRVDMLLARTRNE
ncbi:hypothetical protein ACQX5I_00490 [Corynebacterium diphtheriae]|uniref:hypothetical protein n=1 Tax=Corynebacterium diphtheriae TaxID=1717 RepID=UPI000310DB1D|nr:hypothetical protein [Corynebacterium diphtheriae]CAB0493441.1 hypothetical protein CIP100294_00424 [Corynebacterium diphtheriae]CAB0494688.1 hypothetical protein CIP102550_00486 [Corynebacterium diphtheriae]CAB0494966.1 hypothetical protein CIP100161_00470 [Corynebacterium diphtheriae]CAB0496904.1 hypothetical protein CIP100275_00613 [Corynebacterium diphtheriae]CAB0877756.1 hypothetical protein FRC0405_00545 [Corynebacterium diphtheriae]